MSAFKNPLSQNQFRLKEKKFRWYDNEVKMINENKSWEEILIIGGDEDLLPYEIYRVLEKAGSESYYLIEYQVLEGNPKARGERCKVKCIPRGRIKLKDPVPDKPDYYTVHMNIKKLL